MNCTVVFSLEKPVFVQLLQKVEAKTKDLSILGCATARDTVRDKAVMQGRRGSLCKKVSVT